MYTDRQTHLLTHPPTHTYTHARTRTRTHTHTHMHTNTQTHAHKHTHTHTHLINIIQQLIEVLIISVSILIVEILSHHDHDVISAIMFSLQALTTVVLSSLAFYSSPDPCRP